MLRRRRFASRGAGGANSGTARDALDRCFTAGAYSSRMRLPLTAPEAIRPLHHGLARVARSLLLALVVPLLPLAAQSPSRTTSQTPAHTATASHAPQLSFAVAVTDASGNPVTGLTRGSFSVTDNDHPASLAGFRAVTAAQAGNDQVIYVVDEINLDFYGVAEARDQLSRYLGSQATLAMPSSILLLGDTNERFSGSPSRDGRLLAQELKDASSRMRVIHRSAGIYGDAERLSLSLRAFGSLLKTEQAQPGHKLVIWISGGWPFLAEPGNFFDARQQREQFSLVVQFNNQLLASGVTLDSVDPRGAEAAGGFQAWQYSAYLKGVRRESDVELANLGVQVLATRSGGLVLNSSNNVASELGECVREFGSYYVLTIAADAPTEKIEDHELKVRLTKPGFAVHTTAGYYTVASEP